MTSRVDRKSTHRLHRERSCWFSIRIVQHSHQSCQLHDNYKLPDSFDPCSSLGGVRQPWHTSCDQPTKCPYSIAVATGNEDSVTLPQMKVGCIFAGIHGSKGFRVVILLPGNLAVAAGNEDSITLPQMKGRPCSRA